MSDMGGWLGNGYNALGCIIEAASGMTDIDDVGEYILNRDVHAREDS
jgi:hypothetical protein